MNTVTENARMVIDVWFLRDVKVFGPYCRECHWFGSVEFSHGAAALSYRDHPHGRRVEQMSRYGKAFG